MIPEQELSLEQIEASPIDKTLLELLKVILVGVSKIVADGEQVQPLMFMFTRDQHYVMPLNMADDARKDETAHSMRRALKELNAEAYMVVTEAWAIEPNPTETLDDLLKIRPSKSDRRFEVVSIGGYTRKGEALSVNYDIIREEGASRLAEKTRWLTTEPQEGRFGENLFKPPGVL